MKPLFSCGRRRVFLGDARCPFLLLFVLLQVLIAATVVEQLMGRETAQTMLYRAWWFYLLWGSLALTITLTLWTYRRKLNSPTLLLHVALLLIVLGGGMSRLTGWRTMARLHRAGPPVEQLWVNGCLHRLPFSLALIEAHTLYYPGTSTPKDYQATLLLAASGGEADTVTLALNRIVHRAGYRLFLMDMGHNVPSVGIQVAFDPYGTACSYAGYLLFLLFMLWTMAHRQGRFRWLLRRAILLPALFLMVSIPTQAQSDTLPPIPSRLLDQLVVPYNGRIVPLDTYARDFNTYLTGKMPSARQAISLLCQWMLFFPQMRCNPCIHVESAELLQELGLRNPIALDELFHPLRGYLLKPYLVQYQRNPERPLFQAANQLHEKVSLLIAIGRGLQPTIFPHTDSSTCHWYAAASPLPSERLPPQDTLFIHHALDLLREHIVEHQEDSARQLALKIAAYQRLNAPPGAIPAHFRLTAERIYNAFPFILIAFPYLFLAALLLFLGTPRFPWLAHLSLLLPLLGLLVVGTGYILRGLVLGNVPLTNGLDTNLAVAILLLLLGLGLSRRLPLVSPLSMLIAGFFLLAAYVTHREASLTHPMPILHTPILSVHVGVIMLAYALFALSCLFSLLAVVRRENRWTTAGVGGHVWPLDALAQLLLYPALWLLAAGIFLGACWANISWGAYWSWDSKETWATISLLAYAVLLHSQLFATLRRPMLWNWLNLLCFLLLLITYFGVNLLSSSSLHGYAG